MGLLLGAVGLLRLETLPGRLLNAGPGRCGRMVLAVTLHNLPEGMVVGLAAALALRGEPDAISGALALALGIGLQNIPEGAAVSLPLAQEGWSSMHVVINERELWSKIEQLKAIGAEDILVLSLEKMIR